MSKMTLKQFESVKHQKGIIEQGIDLFNRKASKGLAFLQSHGHLGKSPEDVAAFFHSNERLDKTMIGDFLGERMKSLTRKSCIHMLIR